MKTYLVQLTSQRSDPSEWSENTVPIGQHLVFSGRPERGLMTHLNLGSYKKA